jgi:hypothetical protein
VDRPSRAADAAATSRGRSLKSHCGEGDGGDSEGEHPQRAEDEVRGPGDAEEQLSAERVVPLGCAWDLFRLLFSAYYQRNNLQWFPLRLSDPFPASADWTEATWTVDLLPAEATELSVGLGLNQIGSVTMDDFSLLDAGVGMTSASAGLTGP